MIKKGDKVLYAAILITFAAIPLGLKMIFAADSHGGDPVLEIISAGGVILREPLSAAGEAREIRLSEGGGSNTLSIEGGVVRMSSADCKGGDCVRTRPARAPGDSIVCLPHRLIVRVRDSDERKSDSGLDAVSY